MNFEYILYSFLRRMLRPLLFVFLLIFLVVPSTASSGDRGDGPTKVIRSDEDVPVMPGVVMVRFREGTMVTPGASKMGSAAFDRVADAFGVYAIEPAFPFLNNVAAKRGLSAGVEKLRYIFEVRYTRDVHPKEVAEAIVQDGSVVWAEPRYIHRMFDTIPDDSLFEQQNDLELLQLPEAWDVVKGQQGAVIIAIPDGGTDWRHPDLRANVWTNQDEIPGNNIDDDDNGLVDDVNGWNFTGDRADPTGTPNLPGSALHGTSTAGTASAVTNNGRGIAGASWNAKYMPINVGCPREDNAICFGYDGVLYAALNGASIINASWGAAVRTEFGREVIEAALESGALVIAASGNDFANLDISQKFPANYRGVLSVGATRKDNDAIAGFSNYGRSVDVFAPGVRINATFPDSKYGTISGTSFSTPLTAGVAALIKTRFPDYTPDQIREQIRVTSDPIDAVNDTLAGLLGLGRVNAFRAVTETGHVSVRLIDYTLTTSDGDSLIESGETVTLQLVLVNYLEDTPGVRVHLQSDDRQITSTGAVSAGPLATGDTTVVAAGFEVAEDMPRARNLRLFAEIMAGDYRGTEVIRGLVANPSRATNHQNEHLIVSITDEGNIGFLSTADPITGPPIGEGFVYRQNNLLFEGGLVLGTDPVHISDVVRDHTGVEQNTDLVPTPAATLEIVSPGDDTFEEGSVELNDAGAPQPIGITLAQESFLDNQEAYDDFIVFKYTITNTGSEFIDSFYAGLFFDWDINDAGANEAAFDRDRRLGYIFDRATSAYVGTKLLTTDAALSYRAIDNPSEIYDGFTDEEKWNFLSSGIQTTALAQTDASQIMASGPFTMDPGGAIVVGFAIVAANSQEALLQHADNAQELWDSRLGGVVTPVEPPGPAGRFVLEPIYPNPTSTPPTFTFSLAHTGDVTFGIYDILGREVRRLELGQRGPGTHQFTWDGRDGAGRHVPSGVYLCRYTASSEDDVFTQTRSFVVVH